MAVLSHGDEGQVFGTDGEIQITKLVEPLKRCQSLHGKPKLFFIQVCMKNAAVIFSIFFSRLRVPSDCIVISRR